MTDAAVLKALLRSDLSAARQLADQGVRITTEHSLSVLSLLGMVVQGCIAVRSGDLETGIDTLKKALEDFRATDAHNLLPIFLSFLAEALSRCGKSEEAFATIAEALQLSETTLEVCWEAELYRVKGTLTLQSQAGQRQVAGKSKTSRDKSKSRPKQSTGKAKAHQPTPEVQSLEAEAEECFLKAIEIARRQEAKSLELRAVISLSRLWQQQGKQTDARRWLAETYSWFTEGFETKDLQDAKALLHTLH